MLKYDKFMKFYMVSKKCDKTLFIYLFSFRARFDASR